MTIYIIYFFLILIVPEICSSLFKKRRTAQVAALRILMILMYLILALKAESVGCDISGYKEWYERTRLEPFNDFSYCYMENGYLLLEKIFNLLGFSFQLFAAFLYAVIIIPLYHLIKKYSPDVMISVMILFCLDFFLLACSGLRQAVAMSLCVWAFLIIKRVDSKKNLFFSILVVIAAAFIHKSAALFLPVLFILHFRYKKLTYLFYLIALVIFLLNQHLLINLSQEYELSKYEYDNRLTLGLMFVFDIIMFVFFVISIWTNRYRITNKVLLWQLGNILLYGFVLMIGSNGTMILRSASYELLFLSLVMPIALGFWPKESGKIISFVYIAVLFYCLYFLILEPNTLDIVPYKFFFEN